MNDQLNKEFIPVRPSELVEVVEHTMACGRPCMIWGPPGIGKSDIIAQIGAKHNRPVIDLRLLLMEPTDIKGIPYFDPNTQSMEWAKPSELPGVVTEEDIAVVRAALESASAEVDADVTFSRGEIEGMARNIRMLEGSLALQNAILFLDEINAAPQSVQAAAYQLILNRKVGTYHLPEGVSICAAGNRETDKAVTFRMPSALANRFIHFEMETNAEDWQDWAINNSVNADVIGFIAGHPNFLFNFEPKKSGKAFATPRSWTFVSDLLTDSLSEHLNKVIVAGTVGQGLAGEFMQHVRLKGKLPDPRDIIMGKVTKLKEDKAVDVSAKYSLVIGMCYVMSELQEPTKAKSEKEWDKYSDNFLKFLMGGTKANPHFQKEMVIMAAVTAFRRYNLDFNADTDTFNDFFNEYQEWIV
jgi:hypothetical protein